LVSFFAILAAVSGVDCTRKSTSPLAPPRVPPAAELGRFAPGTADRARRAQLDALTPALDAFFAAKLKESGATGFAVGLILDGELAYQRGFGVRDVASGTPIDSDTVFRIASMTKGFTALSVLKLRDEGKLALDEPAARYLPELGSLVPPTRDAPPLSLRLLLSNASGLAYDDLWGAVTFGKSDAELGALLRGGVQLSTTPGTKYAYSNLGWALLGKVVERVSGKPYRSYVSENILRPLDMSSSAWDARDVPPARLAIGYRREGDALVPEPRPSDGVFDAAGGLYSTLRDYARYASYQLAAYPPRNDAETGPVRRSTLREMHEGQRWVRGDKDSPVARMTDDGISLSAASYGFGWLNVTSCTEEGRVQHGGFEPGYFGWVVLMPSARVGYVALSTTGPAGIASRVGVFDILRKGGLLTPPAPTAHPSLIAAQAAITSLLEAWNPDLVARTFDPQSLEYSWNQHLREDFAGFTKQHGRCQSEGQPRFFGPLHSEFRLVCERGALSFELLLSPATPPLVQNMDVKEELPPDERSEQAAKALTQALNGASESTYAELLGPSIDRTRAKQHLRRLAASHSNCSTERGWLELVHRPLKTEQTSRYSLVCSEGPLELSFSFAENTRQVTSFSAYPARAADATCWQ
jgi:CubicO group peptidase (beta-lactamase class C family)